MKKQKTSSANGITLIALVISIIVMLILAGVSLNAVVGDNGVLTQARQASIASKFASYKEDAELTYVDKYIGSMTDGIELAPPTVLGEYVKNYITKLEDQDVGKFALINGQMYYLGDNADEKAVCDNLGIIVKPIDVSQEDYIAQMETDLVLTLLKNQNGNAFTAIDESSGDSYYLGIKLWDKTVENSNRWKIISEVENNVVKATYGTGWFYVPAGTALEEVGVLSKNYIINYDTQKAVQFDSTKHTMLSFETTLGVKDNLMFCFDPTILESVSVDELRDNPAKYLGNGVELKNLNYTATSGFSKTSYNLDGIDDYIQINFNNFDTEQLYKNGMTYEFYGKFGGTTLSVISTGSSSFSNPDIPNGFGLSFGILNDEYMNSASWFRPKLRYYIAYNSCDGTLVFNDDADKLITWNNHNHTINYSDLNLKKGDTIYFQHVVTPDVENDRISEKVYVNGNFVFEGFSKLSYWRAACDDYKTCNVAMIGMSTSTYVGNYYFFNETNGYANRLYSRALTESELTANYTQSVAYHEYLENAASGSTGGETGGEELEEIR